MQNNIELNFHKVASIIKSDINRGSTHNHWVEMMVTMEDGQNVNLTFWSDEQDKLIIRKEEE